jgi:hypothetical protein
VRRSPEFEKMRNELPFRTPAAFSGKDAATIATRFSKVEEPMLLPCRESPMKPGFQLRRSIACLVYEEDFEREFLAPR